MCFDLTLRLPQKVPRVALCDAFYRLVLQRCNPPVRFWPLIQQWYLFFFCELHCYNPWYGFLRRAEIYIETCKGTKTTSNKMFVCLSLKKNTHNSIQSEKMQFDVSRSVKLGQQLPQLNTSTVIWPWRLRTFTDSLIHTLISLLLPAGAGPFPAVLDLYTLGGGLSEKRAALLASRGFVVLALALYGHDDMPKNVAELHLDYFEEAVEFLKIQNKVSCQCWGYKNFISIFFFQILWFFHQVKSTGTAVRGSIWTTDEATDIQL